ncbi:MAG TPA: TylF/MycF/NovP-related O-methyltransferase [Terriglobales bacterium]|jgi:O-methyltransferase
MAEKAGSSNAGLTYSLGLIRGLRLFSKYRSRTMIGPGTYAENLALIAMALRNPALNQGSIIECGTWRGGMSAGMIEVAGPGRNYHFFDSFAGLPPAGEQDGQKAKDYQRDTASPTYFDNCTASLAEFEKTISLTGISPGKIGIHKGFFEDTLPQFTCPPVAVLRLDADWYESTMVCLEKFWDYILPGGLILIDDYHVWEGCTRAVHAFLAKRDATESVKQGPVGRVAFMIKNPNGAGTASS